jgi:hypothetical protein
MRVGALTRGSCDNSKGMGRGRGRGRWKNVVKLFLLFGGNVGRGLGRYDLDLRGLWRHLGFTLEMYQRTVMLYVMSF